MATKEKEYNLETPVESGNSVQEGYLNALGGENKPQQTGNEYYDLLRNESYKTMLRNNMQASAAKEQAQKYTEQALNANGFANQGLAESTRLGLQQNYMNALQQNKESYSNELLNIKEQERQENLNKQNDDFQSITALMSGATSKEQLDKIMEEYNYGEGLDEASQKQLNLIYSMYSDELGNNSNTNIYNPDNNIVYAYKDDGKTGYADTSNEGDFSAENQTLKFALAQGQIADNSFIRLYSKRFGGSVYLQYVNGNLQQISKDYYDSNAKSDNSYYIEEYNGVRKGLK